MAFGNMTRSRRPHVQMPPKLWKSSFAWTDFAETVSAIREYPVENDSIWCIALDFDKLQLKDGTKSSEEAYNELMKADMVEMDIVIDNLTGTDDDEEPFDFTVTFPVQELTVKFSHRILLGTRENELKETSIGVFSVTKPDATEGHGNVDSSFQEDL